MSGIMLSLKRISSRSEMMPNLSMTNLFEHVRTNLRSEYPHRKCGIWQASASACSASLRCRCIVNDGGLLSVSTPCVTCEPRSMVHSTSVPQRRLRASRKCPVGQCACLALIGLCVFSGKQSKTSSHRDCGFEHIYCTSQADLPASVYFIC